MKLKLNFIKPLIFTLFITLSAFTMSAGTGKMILKGTIAGKNVKVELYINDNDYSVSGSYYYYNSKGKKISSTLNLKGNCNPIGPAKNYFYLTETYNGSYCGSWETNYDAETNRMTGIITNSKGNSYNINLRETK